MMLDITFCSGSRCNRKESCKRWTKNLVEQLKKEQIDPHEIQISVAEFSDHDGNCDGYFIEKSTT